MPRLNPSSNIEILEEFSTAIQSDAERGAPWGLDSIRLISYIHNRFVLNNGSPKIAKVALALAFLNHDERLPIFLADTYEQRREDERVKKICDS